MGEKDPIRVYVKELVSEYMKDYSKQDADKIVQALIPALDKLVADRVKLHLAEIVKYVSEKLNIPV